MYVDPNFKTKKAFREAVRNGEYVKIYDNSIFHIGVPTDGKVTVEGPHYPEPHTWYALVTLKDGKVIKVQ